MFRGWVRFGLLGVVAVWVGIVGSGCGVDRLPDTGILFSVRVGELSGCFVLSSCGLLRGLCEVVARFRCVLLQFGYSCAVGLFSIILFAIVLIGRL